MLDYEFASDLSFYLFAGAGRVKTLPYGSNLVFRRFPFRLL